MRTTHLLIAGVTAQIVAFSGADADVIEIFEDQPAWESALSSQESIFFTEFPPGTFLSDEYAEQGILFTDGDDFITQSASMLDGFGLFASFGANISFERPRTAIAVDFPGLVQFRLFNDGKMIYNSNGYDAPFGEVAFVGILTDQPFDAVLIRNPAGGAGLTIDNLYFGDVIPAPGVMALFGLAAISMRRRRR